jgi:hypothetical protein
MFPVLVIPGETLDKVKFSAQCFHGESLSRDVNFLLVRLQPL